MILPPIYCTILQTSHHNYSDVKALRPDWPQGQKSGLGLELETLWPRP